MYRRRSGQQSQTQTGKVAGKEVEVEDTASSLLGTTLLSVIVFAEHGASLTSHPVHWPEPLAAQALLPGQYQAPQQCVAFVLRPPCVVYVSTPLSSDQALDPVSAVGRS